MGDWVTLEIPVKADGSTCNYIVQEKPKYASYASYGSSTYTENEVEDIREQYREKARAQKEKYEVMLAEIEGALQTLAEAYCKDLLMDNYKRLADVYPLACIPCQYRKDSCNKQFIDSRDLDQCCIPCLIDFMKMKQGAEDAE